MCFQVVTVSASESVEKITYQETEESTEKKMNFFEDLHYRIIYKDTRDFFDYVIFGTAVIALLIVMVFQNTHYIIVTKPVEEVHFLEEKRDYTIEEVVEETKVEEQETLVEEKVEEENPEILSSSLLEDESPKVPNKKNRNKNRRRA